MDKSSGLDVTSSTTSVDNGSDLDETSSTTSEVRGIGLSCERHPGGANDDITTAKHLSDESKDGLSDTLGSKGLVSACLVSESQTAFSVCSAPKPVTEATVCSPSVSRSKHHSRKRPTRALLGHVELAAGRGPQTRARTRAEASRSFPGRQRPRPYSNSEDEFLRDLMHRKLSWEEIEKEFGRRFAGRDRKSLQGRWSRNLKFEARPATCSKPKGK
jgi:hypothetical protein